MNNLMYKQNQIITAFCVLVLFNLSTGCKEKIRKINEDNTDVIKAYCIDFNWGPGGVHGFAKPGLWADADPEAHVRWYKELGCNTIQTFAVSCNGYAWYKNGVVPEQPGLKHDFLSAMAKLGKENGMKVFGYFCAGANNRWEELHPELCYQMDGQQIPFTTQYLDYLCASIEDALVKTDMDGFMLDWLYNPGGGRDPLPALKWLPCEQEMYKELMGEDFPGAAKITPEIELVFRRKSIDRAWERIREAAHRAKPDCIIWLTAYELKSQEYMGSKVLKEADWIMNEAGDVSRTESAKDLMGEHARLITCLASWNQQDPMEVVSHAVSAGVGLYGFTKPVVGNLMKPVDYYLSRRIDELEEDEKNIAVFARTYNDLPTDYVKN
jgi:hypothetical protein